MKFRLNRLFSSFIRSSVCLVDEVYQMGVDQMGVDQIGVDEVDQMGVDEVDQIGVDQMGLE